ncbi:hypothetical protein O3M35_010074 [Rhynocoris fuscipes]|uniref:Uncharacterized protein n=1 Tax=Rhynocoris fuscipes TaxID=488301 RepID=A0AAW1CZ14_9HEMI
MKKQKEWVAKVVDVNQKPSFLELGKELLDKSKLGNADEVLNLISRGAPFATDWVGTSPLHWAAFYNHIEVAETLLMASICRDAKNKVNRTPLHVAAQKGHDKMIQLLLEYGADVNCKDLLKMTPLHWAAESGSKETVKLLLDYGADTSCISVFDKTAATIAKDNNQFEILKLIEETSAMDPSLRALNVRVMRQKNKGQISSKAGLALTPNYPGVRLQVVPKTQKIGIIIDKENPLTGEKTYELLKDDTLVCANTNSTRILSNSLDAMRNNSIKVISDAKLPITTFPAAKLPIPRLPNSKLLNSNSKSSHNSSKIATSVPDCKTVNVNCSNSKTSPQRAVAASASKKIITIKADELINMTKERRVIITDSRPISNARFFEGKLYTEDQKDELAEKVNCRLQEAKKKADHLISQLNKVNEEIDSYNKLLGSLHKKMAC